MGHEAEIEESEALKFCGVEVGDVANHKMGGSTTRGVVEERLK